MNSGTSLKRSISLPFLTFYGLGTIIGAGIYVLIGEVAGIAGMHMPLSFLVASLVAGFTAFSYAELSSRYPRSAGEAVYIHEGFNIRALSTAVGLLIIFVGMVSSATLINGFVNYLNEFVQYPRWIVIVLVMAILGGLAIWGITQSVAAAFILTLVEIAGLVLIIAVSGKNIVMLPERLPEMLPSADFMLWQGIFLGGFLAFYAYIGFEDMVNVAEEVKEPEKNLPLAILFALLISTLFYLVISVLAVLSLSPEELAAAEAPLATIYEKATGEQAVVITVIGLLSVLNGIMIQVIMASRVLYGVSSQGWITPLFSRVNKVTRTPLIATVCVTLLIILLATTLTLVTLAKITSFITLLVFFLINVALLRIKIHNPQPENVWTVRGYIPFIGAVLTILLIIFQLSNLF